MVHPDNPRDRFSRGMAVRRRAEPSGPCSPVRRCPAVLDCAGCGASADREKNQSTRPAPELLPAMPPQVTLTIRIENVEWRIHGACRALDPLCEGGRWSGRHGHETRALALLQCCDSAAVFDGVGRQRSLVEGGGGADVQGAGEQLF